MVIVQVRHPHLPCFHTQRAPNFESSQTLPYLNLYHSSTNTSNLHAASFAGLTFLSIYLYHKLHPSHSRTSIFPHQNWRILISLVPLLGAILIAVTRIMDARHHPFDVLSGSFLGIMTAILGWRQYFPISWEDCADQSDGNLFLPITQQDDVDQGLEDSGAVD